MTPLGGGETSITRLFFTPYSKGPSRHVIVHILARSSTSRGCFRRPPSLEQPRRGFPRVPRERGRGGYGLVRHDGGERVDGVRDDPPATASAPPEPVEPKPAAPPAAPDPRSMVLARSFRSCPSVMAHAAKESAASAGVPPLTPGEKVSPSALETRLGSARLSSGASLAPPFSASCARMLNAIIGGRIPNIVLMQYAPAKFVAGRNTSGFVAATHAGAAVSTRASPRASTTSAPSPSLASRSPGKPATAASPPTSPASAARTR